MLQRENTKNPLFSAAVAAAAARADSAKKIPTPADTFSTNFYSRSRSRSRAVKSARVRCSIGRHFDGGREGEVEITRQSWPLMYHRSVQALLRLHKKKTLYTSGRYQSPLREVDAGSLRPGNGEIAAWKLFARKLSSISRSSAQVMFRRPNRVAGVRGSSKRLCSRAGRIGGGVASPRALLPDCDAGMLPVLWYAEARPVPFLLQEQALADQIHRLLAHALENVVEDFFLAAFPSRGGKTSQASRTHSHYRGSIVSILFYQYFHLGQFFGVIRSAHKPQARSQESGEPRRTRRAPSRWLSRRLFSHGLVK